METYGSRFVRAGDTFLARQANLEAIAKSLHYKQSPLTADDFSPEGFHGAPNATREELEAFVRLLEEEASKDRFLDKHFQERDHMREAAETHHKVEEMHAMLERAMPFIPEEFTDSQEDSWQHTTITDIDHSEGWLPEQGQIYTKRLPNGASLKYMLHGDLMGVEYTYPDSNSWYVDIDVKGNIKNHRSPFPLTEYEIIVPEKLFVRRREVPLPDDRTYVDITLKWGNYVRFILDRDGRLQTYMVKGPSSIKHEKRVIKIRPPGYLDKLSRE
jgi:hypothetical protein